MDRIFDAYNGTGGFGVDFVRKTRERLKWICEQVSGTDVLDIGCSQGVCPILLGQAGFKVLGMDINPDAVEFARGKLSEQEYSVQQSVEFVQGNFATCQFSNRRFDTVIFGEVLEHLLRPEVFIANAHMVLNTGGRVVITVPFGINDDPDHKQTFYFSRIKRILYPYFDIQTVRYFGSWIGFVAIRRSDTVVFEPSADFLDLECVEQAVFGQERQLRDKISELMEKSRRQGENAAAHRDRAAKLSAELTQCSQKLSQCVQSKKELEKRNQVADALEERVGSLEAAVSNLEGEKFALLEELAEKDAALANDEEVIQSEREAKRSALSSIASLAGQIETLKKEVGIHVAELKKLRTEKTVLANRCHGTEKQRADFSSLAYRAGKDVERLKDELAKTKAKLVQSQKRLDILSNAKLCRLTLKYWRLKDAIKARLRGKPHGTKPSASVVAVAKPVLASSAKNPVAASASPVHASSSSSLLDRLAARLAKIPVSNGCRYYVPFKTRIGIICDRFYWDSVKDAADFVYLTPADWREQLGGVDCLLYVTAWRGLHEEWHDLFHEDKPNRQTLYAIIDACRDLGKPTIFYSKEDPPHFDESVNIAKRCDYVFTTCEEVIPRYRAACGHERIAILKFGINPLYHNPVGMRSAEKEPGVIFSGSWSVQYPRRCADLGGIFDGVLAAGRRLEIVDRNYARRDDPAFALPPKYRSCQNPSIDHDNLQKVHKLFDWAVNINSIQNSRTMFANRVYELQAAGNLLLSNFSLGVSREFPGVFIVDDANETQSVLAALSPHEIYSRQIAGVRRVMTGETCYDRLGQVLSAIGKDGTVAVRKILVVADRITERLRDCFDNQSYSEKRLVAEDEVNDVDFASADIVTFFGADYVYGPHYLEDMANGFKYTNCDYVTKSAFLDGGREAAGPEHDYVAEVPDKYRTLFWRESFKLDELLSAHGAFACPNGYASDRLGCERNPPEAKAEPLPGVSVIVPTYRPNSTIFSTVESVLSQQLPGEGVEVLICVNGGDEKWRDELQSRYAQESRVRVLFTERRGVNAGRNMGVAAAGRPLLAFLDDDDYFTPGYLRVMACGMVDAEVKLAVGMLGDWDDRSGQLVANRVIARTFRKVGAGICNDWMNLLPVFSTFTCKLYRTDFFRMAFGVLDESESHSEDIVFWSENVDRLTGCSIYVPAPESRESYVRRRVPDSLSRPKPEQEYAFYVTDRLHILDRLERILLDPTCTLKHKQFVLEKVRTQTAFMLKFVEGADASTQTRARKEIFAHRNLFLNRSRFATRKAIAFCHNFAPFVDASAFVATKRLREIEELEGAPLHWHVVSQDMDKVRTRDDLFQQFYAELRFWKQTMVKGPSAFMPEQQVPFAESAVKAVAKEEAEVVYSRSLFVGSHIAAYNYKRAHPQTVWYAEFSDPAAYGVDNHPRNCTGSPSWFDIEQMVYALADKIIFTNANQMEFMLSYNPHPRLNALIRERAIVLHHPVLPHEYCNLVGAAYALDPTKINIGYFGTFYVTRKADDMLRLLDNPKVVLHVFTTKPEELRVQLKVYGNQVRVNSTVSQFEVLNLGSRMDYLYLNDTEFPGEINPFLPSKYADYLATGTSVIAKVQPGSVISRESNPRVLKVCELTADFVANLHKKSLSDVECPGVSVIIPTWRKNETLGNAVASVLAQDYPSDRIHVYVGVNGGDEAYRQELERTFANEPRVSVLFTKTPGPNAGRNLGLRAAETPLLAFLDDDDTLSPGFLREMASGFQNPSVTVSFGRMVNLDVVSGKVEANTYINRALVAAGPCETERHIVASSLLSTLCGKMYRTDFFRRTLGFLDEAERHSEDMLFWAERFNRLSGVLHFCDPAGPEAYVRHVTNNSLSRPSADRAYAFYVTDRIRLIRRLQEIQAAAQSPDHRKVLKSKLEAQVRVMREYVATLPTAERKQAETDAGDLLSE